MIQHDEQYRIYLHVSCCLIHQQLFFPLVVQSCMAKGSVTHLVYCNYVQIMSKMLLLYLSSCVLVICEQHNTLRDFLDSLHSQTFEKHKKCLSNKQLYNKITLFHWVAPWYAPYLFSVCLGRTGAENKQTLSVHIKLQVESGGGGGLHSVQNLDHFQGCMESALGPTLWLVEELSLSDGSQCTFSFFLGQFLIVHSS